MENLEIKYKILFNSLPEAIYIADEKGQIIETNETFKRIITDKNELKTEDFWVNNKDIEIISEFFKDKEFIENYETSFYGKNDIITGLISLSTLILKNKPYVMGIIRDITDKKIIETELLDAKNFSENLIETSNAIVIGVDTKGIVNIFNKAAEKTTGYTKDEIIGKNWFDTMTPIDKIPYVWEEFNRQLKDNSKDKIFENPIFTKNGGTRDILWQSNNLYNSKSDVIGLVSFGIDITERKKVEKELIDAKEKAEKSDKLKTTFLANMSHEIRTPLNSLIGFSHFIMNKELTESEKNKYTSIINSSGNHLLDIINDVLDISKIEIGQVELYNSEVCVNDVIREVSLNKPPNNNKNLFVYTTLTDDESTIITDESKLRQILTNLMTNAIKFTHKGNIQIGYDLVDGFLQFYVSDSGIGISEDKLEVIFERFRQAEEGLSKKYGGTGLGLSISKSHVEMMGGKIWVESKMEEGSTFYFTIPYKPIKISLEEMQKDENLVLVVEDNEDIFLYLNVILSNKKISIVHAENAKQAIYKFKLYKDKIKLVLMDMRLPDKLGYEVVPEILEIKNVPIVAQSAYSFSTEKDLAMKSGCIDYITKPFKEETLNKILDKYFFKKE